MLLSYGFQLRCCASLKATPFHGIPYACSVRHPPVFQHSTCQEEERGADVEEYRVKMNLRKSRAKKFLENETTLFTLLFCLTLYGVLQQAVRICFRLFNSDKVSLGLPDVADVKRAERRRRGKQEEGPPELAVSRRGADTRWATSRKCPRAS